MVFSASEIQTSSCLSIEIKEFKLVTANLDSLTSVRPLNNTKSGSKVMLITNSKKSNII